MSNQTAYAHTLYTGQFVAQYGQSWRAELLGAALRGILSTCAGLLVALTSVFRGSIARRLRVGAFLERGVPALRSVQSGHPGDYVAWLTVGVATFGALLLGLLRS